jgi:hypothetical protein
MTDEQLREVYGRLLGGGSGPAGDRSGRCVTPEQLLALIRREGTEAQRLEILDHVMACDACRRELDLLRAVEQAGIEMGAGAATGRRFHWRRFAPLALAASVLLAVGVVLGVWRSGDSPDIPRGGGAAVLLLAPPERISVNQPVTFAWQAVPNAHQYVFELLDTGSGATALSRTTSDTVVVLQPDQVLRGRQYQWWVRALTPAGELASPMRDLRVRRE